jgi:hypothetical protein
VYLICSKILPRNLLAETDKTTKFLSQNTRSQARELNIGALNRNRDCKYGNIVPYDILYDSTIYLAQMNVYIIRYFTMATA